MEDKIFIVFDDTNEKSEIIKDVIGNRGFGDVIVKKHGLESYFYESVKKIFLDFMFVYEKSIFEFNDLQKRLGNLNENIRILHFFSNYIISDSETAFLSLKKLLFIEKPYRVLSEKSCSNCPALVMFPDS